MRQFRGEVRHGTGRAHAGKRHLYQQPVAGGGVEVEPRADFPARHLREIVLLVEAAVETAVRRRIVFPVPVPRHRPAERHGEVDRSRARPARRLAITGHQRVVLNPQKRPDVLSLVVVDVGRHVEHEVGFLAPGERIAVHADAGRCRQLDAGAVVVERDTVVTGLGALGVVPEAGMKAPGVRAGAGGRRARGSGRWHQRDISQVGMSGPAEVCMAESEDRAVLVLVTRTVAIHLPDIVAGGVVHREVPRVRAQLHHAEGHRGSRKRMPHVPRADHRIDQGGIVPGVRATRRR